MKKIIRILCFIFALSYCINAFPSNMLNFESASIEREGANLYFDFTWKKNYKMSAPEDEDYITFDFRGVEVKRTRSYNFEDNSIIKYARIGQYQANIARIALKLRKNNSAFNHEAYFKMENGKTKFIIKLRSKDNIFEIIKDNSFVLILDPGHGGADPGCTSPNGYNEKNIVLKIAKDIKKEFNRRNLGIIHMTREKDIFLTLDERIKQAIDRKGSLFISLHVDTYPNDKSIRGIGIYYLSQNGASDKRTEELVKKENDSDSIGGVKKSDNQELYSILFSLKQTRAIEKSAVFSGILFQTLKNKHFKVHGVRQAGFRVLKNPDMPAVLIETGYFSNKYDEKLLIDSSYRRKIAYYIVDAIEKYKNDYWKNKN